MGVFVFRGVREKSPCLSRPFAASADRPSNRDECSLAFETPDNTGNEQRCVLGSALLEEKYVILRLSARAITEPAQDQTRHAAGIPYESETFTQPVVVTDLSEVRDPGG